MANSPKRRNSYQEQFPGITTYKPWTGGPHGAKLRKRDEVKEKEWQYRSAISDKKRRLKRAQEDFDSASEMTRAYPASEVARELLERARVELMAQKKLNNPKTAQRLGANPWDGGRRGGGDMAPLDLAAADRKRAFRQKAKLLVVKTEYGKANVLSEGKIVDRLTLAGGYNSVWISEQYGYLKARSLPAAQAELKLLRASKPNPRKRARRNPDDAAAVAASEGFHGRAASEVTVIETPVKVHGQLAELGDLISLEVRALNGNIVELSNFEGALLAMSPARNQLYIEGGDQVVNLEDFGIDADSAHDSEILGHCRRVRYYTTKDHLGDEGGEATYKHRFGEAGGLEPHLVYDCVNGLLSFAGGSYTIPDEGITD